ncbi:MAG: DUF4405 domain-containing protein [Chloroflexi bacterium]|nr:DUF4405 domain-containing protein [Chloroflexota bacterium]
MRTKARINLGLDILIGLAFLVEAVSGFVLWLVLPGGYQGGRNPAYGRRLILTHDGWVLLHDWFAVAMTVGIVLHIALHWRWITHSLRAAWRNAFDRPEPPASNEPDQQCPA